MSDPRVERWLELTEQALSASDRMAALESLLTERARLRASLEADPPATQVGAQLSERLRRAERALEGRLAALRADLLGQLANTRHYKL